MKRLTLDSYHNSAILFLFESEEVIRELFHGPGGAIPLPLIIQRYTASLTLICFHTFKHLHAIYTILTRMHSSRMRTNRCSGHH